MKKFNYLWIKKRVLKDEDAQKLVAYFERIHFEPHHLAGRRLLLESLDTYTFDFSEMKQILYDLELKFHNERFFAQQCA